jgi:serine/threonine-protein kinase
MAIKAVPELVLALRGGPLLENKQVDALVSDLAPRFDDVRALGRELVRREWLTPFQINQVFQGRGADLVLGPYVLLERLGEGAMGHVYKARHSKMKRVVALKVMRRDKLTNAEAVRRFFREVQLAATLDHPNIVRGFDADEANGTYFFAMEYVEGDDLGQLVKQKGALKIGKACEYVRQAALGLQHAHEKGLVHRDIKPSNIIVRSSGSHSEAAPLVKLLDMGLARVCGPLGDDGSEPLTQIHAVLGTPDFIAPEQARSAREVDIRSDLYSLGCTFYYVLTGRVPFPAETAMEKLLKHYLEPPPRVDALRPEVPRGISALVRKLMAKDPAARPQTPAEVARVLGTMVAVPAPARVRVAVPVGPTNPARPEAPANPSSHDEVLAGETVPEVDLEFATSDSIGRDVPVKDRLLLWSQRRPLLTFGFLGAVLGLLWTLVVLLVRYALP